MKKEQRFILKMKDYDLDSPSEKQKYNKELFTPVSLVYHNITKVLSFGRDRSWKNKLMEMLRETVLESVPENAPRKVLDIACGPGDLSFLCADELKNAKITGIDLNRGMLQKAEENLSRMPAEIKERINFREGDMSALDFPKEEFSVITGGYALRNAPDLPATMRELLRVLKPGGTAFFLDFAPASGQFQRKIQTGLLSIWGRIWGFIYHRNPEVYGYISESLKRFPPKDKFIHLAEETGFKPIRYTRLFFGFIFLASFRKQQ